MKKSGVALLVLLFLSSVAAQAQEQALSSPPKILLIYREFLKPGKAGTPHEKTEAAFVRAYEKAKWPEHYLALESLSGRSRALFLFGYDSLEAMEKDRLATEKDRAFSAAIDRASIADGDLLTPASDEGVFRYRADLSYNSSVDIAHMRYLVVVPVWVRPGHVDQFVELLKTLNEARAKANAPFHAAVFQTVYGGSFDLFLVFEPIKSLAEQDRAFADDVVGRALGEAGRKKVQMLAADSVHSVERQLFAFAPRMSYPPEAWVKADPEFWNPKPANMPARHMGAAKKAKAAGK
jgi:hypothetical protein